MPTVNRIGGMVISYNRKGSEAERGYIVTNGDGTAVVHTPPGKAGKEAAMIQAIEIENPHLYQLAKYMTLKNPVLGKRIWAACKLIINGHVLPPVPGNLVNEVAQVISETDESVTYTVQYRDGQLCNCEDYQFQKSPTLKTGQRYCKHILAHLINQEMNKLAKQTKSVEKEAAYV